MQERFMPYPIPQGWTVFFPEGWVATVDDGAQPAQVVFQRPDTAFSAHCIVWHFTQSPDGAPASVERLQWLFAEAALRHPMEEIDRSLYAPPGFSMRAYRGQTDDCRQMLAFAICTPGYLLTVYLLGDDKEIEQLLCRGLRRITRTADRGPGDGAAQRPAPPRLQIRPAPPPRTGPSHSEGGKPGNGPAWL